MKMKEMCKTFIWYKNRRDLFLNKRARLTLNPIRSGCGRGILR